MGFTPVLAAMAFGVLPAAAQATPHWYKNGVRIPEGAKAAQTLWGTLTRSALGEGYRACNTVVGAVIENPPGGGAGKGETLLFASYCCAAGSCPLLSNYQRKNSRGAAYWKNQNQE